MRRRTARVRLEWWDLHRGFHGTTELHVRRRVLQQHKYSVAHRHKDSQQDKSSHDSARLSGLSIMSVMQWTGRRSHSEQARKPTRTRVFCDKIENYKFH